MAAMRLHLDSISKAYIYFLPVNSLVVLSLLTSFSKHSRSSPPFPPTTLSPKSTWTRATRRRKTQATALLAQKACTMPHSRSTSAVVQLSLRSTMRPSRECKPLWSTLDRSSFKFQVVPRKSRSCCRCWLLHRCVRCLHLGLSNYRH